LKEAAIFFKSLLDTFSSVVGDSSGVVVGDSSGVGEGVAVGEGDSVVVLVGVGRERNSGSPPRRTNAIAAEGNCGSRGHGLIMNDFGLVARHVPISDQLKLSHDGGQNAPI
jgi:hypothetical protein